MSEISLRKPGRHTLVRAGSRAIVIALLVWLSGCAGAPIEQRDGYAADHTHTSTAFDRRIRYLVLHYTGSGEERSLRTLMGPRVSSHYLVPEIPEVVDGQPKIWQLVDEHQRAWHAGVSAWEDRSQLNDTSIGIEIVNRGPLDDTHQTWEAYTDAQVEAVIALARDIITRYRLPPTAVVAHADIAPERKIDPGPAFPWQRLFEAGIGAWPDTVVVDRYREAFRRCPPSIAQYQGALAAYGYEQPINGEWDSRTRAVTRAFQMHFRPARYDGTFDTETAAIVWALLARYHPDRLEAPGLRLAPTCPADSESDRGSAP